MGEKKTKDKKIDVWWAKKKGNGKQKNMILPLRILEAIQIGHGKAFDGTIYTPDVFASL